jgi:hypothetical protein
MIDKKRRRQEMEKSTIEAGSGSLAEKISAIFILPALIIATIGVLLQIV